MTSWLHERRLAESVDVVVQSGARTVLDLGCGDGDLLVRLAKEPQIKRIVGLDICAVALERLRARWEALKGNAETEVEIRLGSMTEAPASFANFDCAVLIETIEHIAPDRLSLLERAVFSQMRPGTVVITTPNAEYNPLLGVPPHRFRHPGHKFEWDRAKFRKWTAGVAARNRYQVACRDIAGAHPVVGGASQMAVFTTGGVCVVRSAH
ncbi:MAG: methyltransferase type 12 [Alphaproteobacteria bacterium HGW-Alphaproteobacteria-18]|nr:MAG: methyltransferase type 12 [Alphaproteobacteria bacterium HGW-Alphaproteobacteria-18]